MSKKLIYISGKYGGKEENKIDMECAIRYFREYEGCVGREYISPITAFSFLYNETEYLEGLDCCLTLLDKCDKIYMLPGWEDSTGACIEFGYAKASGKEIYFADDLYSREEFKEIKSRYMSQISRENNLVGCSLTDDMINPKHLGVKSKPTPWIPSDWIPSGKPKIAHYWGPKYKGAWF